MRLRRETFTTALAVLAVMAMVAGPLAAQADQAAAATTPTPHQGMMLQRLTTKLGLSEEQQASAKSLFAERQTKLQPLQAAQKQLHTQLKAALGAATPDAATVGQAVISMHQNRAQIEPIMQSYHQQFEALLNADQLATYKQMLAAHSHLRHARVPANTQTQ
jgi:Spy/CpxP family protein refolding chaperone